MGTKVRLNQAFVDDAKMKKRLQMSTTQLGLPVRTTNCLDDYGITTVGDLLKCSREELLRVPNFGEKTLEEVLKALEKLDFYREGMEPKQKKAE